MQIGNAQSPAESGSHEFFLADYKEANARFLPWFLGLSCFGMLVYSLYDYYSAPELWLQFLVLRSATAVAALVLYVLAVRDKIFRFRKIRPHSAEPQPENRPC